MRSLARKAFSTESLPECTQVKSIRSYDYIGALLFLLLALGAIYWAKERILITDPAFYLFQIINDQKLLLAENRPVTIINQLLALLCVKAGAPLPVVVAVYSFSFVLVSFAFYFIVNYVLKNQVAGLTLLLVLVTGMTKSYYRPTSESNLALFSGLLLYAWLEYIWMHPKSPWQRWQYPVALIVILLGYFSHPLALFYLLFPLGFHLLDRQRWKSRLPYLVAVAIGVLFGSRILFNTSSASSEGSIYGELIVAPSEIWETLSSSYVLTFLESYYVEVYPPLTLIFIVASFGMIRSRKWVVLAFSVLFALFYFVVTCLSFHSGESDMQMEKILLPFTLIFGMGFSRYFLTYFPYRYIGALALIFVLLVGITRIENVRYLFVKRLEYYSHLLDQTKVSGQGKVVTHPENVQRHLLRYHWASGVESLLISSLKGPEASQTLLITEDIDSISEIISAPNTFIPIMGWTYTDLNARYFSLPSHPYFEWKETFK